MDNGLTWTEPLDLLENTENIMEQPHIACDSKNYLYVTYTHDGYGITPEGRLIKMLVWDGFQWNEPIVVSESMPGSHYSKILTNNKDDLYVLWGYLSDEMYYRYRKNNQWSDIFCPYCDSTDLFYFSDGICISNSMMHLSGSSISYNYYGERPQYYLYNTISNTWQNPEMINQDTMLVDIDLSLDKLNDLKTTYRKVSHDTYGSFSDSCMLVANNELTWLPPELVSGTDKRQKGQQIAIDQNNDPHVVETEYYNSTELETKLVHYYKIKNTWFSQSIDSSDNLCNMPKLVFSNNKLYVVYVWDSDELDQRYIRFSKYDVLTSVNNPGQQKQSLDIYPNPGSDNIYIEFENKARQPINLSIFDMTGKMITTLTNRLIPSGKQKFTWNGTDQNGNKVINGSYIVRLKTGQKSIAQKVEIVR